jgi:hypothetical protein
MSFIVNIILTEIQFDMRGMTDQFPPSSLQSKEVLSTTFHFAMAADLFQDTET